MIYESWPWRRDLLRDADVLERWEAKPGGERRSVIIEKKVFIGAYSMRRLLQSGKLSTSTENRNQKLDRFPASNPQKPIGKYDRWDIDEHYILSAGSQQQLTIPRLLDLIIHSFIFQESVDETQGSTDIVFTSDAKRSQYIWMMSLLEFSSLMRFVANDVPAVTARRFDHNSGEWIEWRGAGKPPWWGEINSPESSPR